MYAVLLQVKWDLAVCMLFHYRFNGTCMYAVLLQVQWDLAVCMLFYYHAYS
jgi:hypothetical protein